MLKRTAVAIVALSLAVPMAAQTTSDAEVRAQLKAILENQVAMQKDLAELRKLVENLLRPAAPPPPPPLPAAVDITNSPQQGQPAARIALIEYSDYQCSFCGRFVRDTYSQIDKDYVKTGKVRHIFRNLPLDFHPNAFKAAQAAHCAGEQKKYWEMHDYLFGHQQELDSENLPKHAAAIGLDVPRFQQCLASGKFDAQIRAEITEAGASGVNGTPTFFIGEISPDGKKVKVAAKLVGAQPYSEFKTLLDAALAVKTQ